MHVYSKMYRNLGDLMSKVTVIIFASAAIEAGLVIYDPSSRFGWFVLGFAIGSGVASLVLDVVWRDA